MPPEELAEYLSEIGVTLLAYGCPTYRLEDVLRTVAQLEGHAAEAFAIPTALFVSLRRGPGRAPVHRMTRVKHWGTNLDRLAQVDAIFNEVAERRLSIVDATQSLRTLEARPLPWPRQLRWVAVALSSASAAVFFRGGPADAVVAAVTALEIYALSRLMGRLEQGRFLVDFAGGFLSAAMAWLASSVRPDVSREVVVLAGAIALVPGLTLTTSLAELAQKSLVSGAARLMDAFFTFLSIVTGIAVAVGLEKTVTAGTKVSAEVAEATAAAVQRTALGLPWQMAALVAAAVSFAVLFAVPRRYLAAGVASGALGYVTTAVATRHLPAHVAAMLAALTVCLFANGAARITQRPAQLFQLPGMMLLVPGSFGFLSLEEFLRGRFVEGAEKGFAMLLIAGGLVMGVLAANVLLPARKLL